MFKQVSLHRSSLYFGILAKLVYSIYSRTNIDISKKKKRFIFLRVS